MISPRLRPILEAEYPRFSEPEMARRRLAVEGLLAEAGCEHLVFCGANRFGSAVQWLTGWPVTAEAVGVFSPGERDALFVQYHNHVPQARKLARDADVAWGGAIIDRARPSPNWRSAAHGERRRRRSARSLPSSTRRCPHVSAS